MDSNKNNEKKYGVIVIGFVIICVILLIFALFKKLTKKEVMDFVSTQTVNVTHVQYGDIEKEISVTGIVEPIDNSSITAKCSGELLEIYVKNGDRVKKGDLICKIDNKKALDSAKISFDQAKNTFERYRKLYQTGNLSKQNYEDYRTSYERAKLEYDTQLEYSTPTALSDGVVEGMSLNVNTTINIGTTICNINSESSNEIKFGVSERVLSGIKIGDKVTVTKQGVEYDASIESISRQVNVSTGQFDVKAIITSENNLASGVLAKCTFVYDKKSSVPYLNRNIVYYEGEEPYVFTVKDDEIIEKVFIKTGIENRENVEVISGIDDETKIISTWSNDLAEGSLVKILHEDPINKRTLTFDSFDSLNDNEIETKISTFSDTFNIDEDTYEDSYSTDSVVKSVVEG